MKLDMNQQELMLIKECIESSAFRGVDAATVASILLRIDEAIVKNVDEKPKQQLNG